MDIKALEEAVARELSSIHSFEDLKRAKVSLAGRKEGLFSRYLDELKTIDKAQRGLFGRAINEIKGRVEARLDELEKVYLEEERLRREREAFIDITMPGKRPAVGKKHPITLVFDEIERIFSSLGFRVAEGPDIELDYYNFEALNQPPYHPSRSLQDTLYVSRKDPYREYPDDVLLRTHTSPVQVRVMESRRPPLFVVSPGKAYRKDEIDATHSAMFHQVEGFAVGREITMGHLKGTLEVFVRKLFGSERKVRFTPHFFPFTEPSAEVYVSCYVCDGAGCGLCKSSGWLEILGCGMIDPKVFEYVGYDPEEYTGFAFGVGIERVAMLKYGIDDMRVFFENDMRFLEQF